MWVRRKAYAWGWKKSYQAKLPVISVGNLSTGGTGKTPFSEYLMGYFQQMGKRPAYLSRGYGREKKGFMLLNAKYPDPSGEGDEPTQVKHKFPDLPIAVCEDRRAGIMQLQQNSSPDLIILDDAFQHLRVKRDLDIVVIDAQRLPFQDFPLPTGNLREFRASLKEADMLLINKVKDEREIPRIKQILQKYRRPMTFCRPAFQSCRDFEGNFVSMDRMRTKRIMLFSGIGNNAYFKAMVQAYGFEVVEALGFADHHKYRYQELKEIFELGRSKDCLMGTTEKDRMRLWKHSFFDSFDTSTWFYFPIELEFIEGKRYLDEALEKLRIN